MVFPDLDRPVDEHGAEAGRLVEHELDAGVADEVLVLLPRLGRGDVEAFAVPEEPLPPQPDRLKFARPGQQLQVGPAHTGPGGRLLQREEVRTLHPLRRAHLRYGECSEACRMEPTVALGAGVPATVSDAHRQR